jgi:hypothetical protein
MPVGVITVEAAHAKRMLARPAAKRARQDAAKARLEQTAQPPKNEPQSAVATRLSCLKLRSHHPVVLAWPGCIGRLYRAGRQEHEAANRNICTHRDASVGRSKPNGSIEARVLPGKPLSIEVQRHKDGALTINSITINKKRDACRLPIFPTRCELVRRCELHRFASRYLSKSIPIKAKYPLFRTHRRSLACTALRHPHVVDAV